ncbi:MAG: membrane protein insertase YidC, partial [Dehalococcoidia bacterium]|nr:membrane protein insertase YidC [Dehalococcoidia bacterium]
QNFGIAIVVFTVLVRLATMPLTLRQTRAMKNMQSLQPRIQELQKKYPKDKPRLQQEQMKLMKEAGVNPLGCLGPMVIQMPIWIGLYWAILQAMAVSPEDLLQLSGRLYSWAPAINQLVPLNKGFLWLDLSLPDRTFVMPVLVGASMWVQQKMTTVANTDPRQGQMNQLMLWMMPLMFAFFTLSFPSGLALYWVVSNGIGIVIQYFASGWGGLATMFKPKPAPAEGAPSEGTPSEVAAAVPAEPKGADDGQLGSKRKNRRRGR